MLSSDPTRSNSPLDPGSRKEMLHLKQLGNFTRSTMYLSKMHSSK